MKPIIPIEVYHATRNLDAVMDGNVIRPMRLPNVYLFEALADAIDYAVRFGYVAVVTCWALPGDIQRKWKPAYCKVGRVIKLKDGMTSVVVSREVVFIRADETFIVADLQEN